MKNHHPCSLQVGLAEFTAAALLIFILCGNNEATHDVTRLHIGKQTGCNTWPCTRLMSPDGAGGAAERKPVKLPTPGRASEVARRHKTDICDIPGLIRMVAVVAVAARQQAFEAFERKFESTFP